MLLRSQSGCAVAEPAGLCSVPGVVQRRHPPPEPGGLGLGGGAGPGGGGADQLWARGSAVGCALGGAAAGQGGHRQGLAPRSEPVLLPWAPSIPLSASFCTGNQSCAFPLLGLSLST